jgi:hypothetical protein
MFSATALLAGPVTVVRESFDYLEGGALAGGATGTGWAGTWAEAGESGDLKSELILGPGSFSVPPGAPATAGNHVDLNRLTGARTITRRMSTTLGAQAGAEYVVTFVLDFGSGPGAGGVDYAGIELSNSAGGPVVFIGKPAGPGPANDGTIVMDVYGQGLVGTGVPADGQKYLQLRWIENGAGAEQLTLTVFSTAGAQLGTAGTTTQATFNQLRLTARRDLAFGGFTPAFDEFVATVDTAPTRALTVNSTNPASGVAITVNPDDSSGQGYGTTPFARNYSYGTNVFLTAPLNAGGNVFTKWQRDGVDVSTNVSVVVAMNANRTMTAVYVTPPTYPLDEQITDIDFEGSDIRVTWSSVGGRTYLVQATSNLAAGFTDISGPIFVSGTGRMTTDFVDPAAASSPERFYRLKITAP